MRSVALPGTDLQVSALCMGSTKLGAALTVDQSFALLDEYIALGGSFIDTAHVYANWIHGTKSIVEKLIGRWLSERGLRDQIVLATKGAHPELATMRVSRLSRSDILRDLSESLEYLKTDRIDLYWLHRDDPKIPVGEIIDSLSEQVAAGTIRYFGASNWTIPRIQAALDYSAARHLPTFVANQPMWSLAQPNMARHPDQTIVAMDDAGLAFHRRTGMAAIAYSSQAHGYFSKLDAGGSGIAKDDRLVYDNPTNAKRFKRIKELARRYRVPINDIVLAYLLSQPFTTIPIIGPKDSDQLRSSVQATELTLTPDEVTYLEAGDGA